MWCVSIVLAHHLSSLFHFSKYMGFLPHSFSFSLHNLPSWIPPPYKTSTLQLCTLLFTKAKSSSRIMSSPSSFRHEILKKWLVGLQFCSNSKKKMSILERKNAIKLSADVAMASARNDSICWSRALIATAAKNSDNKLLINEILGDKSEKIKYTSIAMFSGQKMIHRSKKILKRSRRICRVKKMAPKISVKSSIVAKRLVKKRTQILEKLVPGGKFMEEFILLEEALDYIVSLKAQIDVMKSLANASEH